MTSGFLQHVANNNAEFMLFLSQIGKMGTIFSSFNQKMSASIDLYLVKLCVCLELCK